MKAYDRTPINVLLIIFVFGITLNLFAASEKKLNIPFNFNDRVISQTKLQDLNIPGADFRASKIIQSSFTTSNLSSSDFRRARIRNSRFWYSDLRNSRFDSADLFGVSFRGSDLRGADFSSAVLINCDFRDSKTNPSTIFPDQEVGLSAQNKK